MNGRGGWNCSPKQSHCCLFFSLSKGHLPKALKNTARDSQGPLYDHPSRCLGCETEVPGTCLPMLAIPGPPELTLKPPFLALALPRAPRDPQEFP